MQVQGDCKFISDAQIPSHAVSRVETRLDGSAQVLDEQLSNNHTVPTLRYLDNFGNLCRRTTIYPRISSIRYNARREISKTSDPQCLDASEGSPQNLPSETLFHTLPIQLYPFKEFANETWNFFGSLNPYWVRAQTKCDRVTREITFGYDKTLPLATASQRD